MTNYAACCWCGDSWETGSIQESADLLTEHLMHCEEGPIATVLKILEQYGNPFIAEKAKEEIRCKLMR